MQQPYRTPLNCSEPFGTTPKQVLICECKIKCHRVKRHFTRFICFGNVGLSSRANAILLTHQISNLKSAYIRKWEKRQFVEDRNTENKN